MPLLDELLVRIGMDSSGVDEGADQVTNRLDSLAGPAAAAGAAAGGLFAVGISSAMDIAGARSNLQSQLGLTAAESQRAGDVAGEVFSAGFAGSLDEVNASLGGIHSGIGDLGDFTDAELKTMSQSALGLAKTFEVEVSDATGAVGQLIKTGLVKDATEGFDLVTRAMQMVPAELRDDLLPTIQEYSTQFRRVGLDGQTSMGLLAQAVEAGARDLDQVADGIGQFGERALAGGTAVDDAFKSIGLNSKDMAKMIGAGGESAEKALQMTMDGLRGASDEQTKLNAAAALFGDPANVMGDALFALDPATAPAATGMDKAAGAAKGLTDHMAADPAVQLDSAMNTFKTTLGEALLPILLKVSHFMAEHEGLMKILVPVVIGLGIAFGIFAVAVWAVNIAMMANPIAWIILGIMALIAVVILVIYYWDEIAAATAEAWDWIVRKLGEAWDWIIRKVIQVWDWINRTIGGAWDWVVKKTVGFVASVLGFINGLAKIPGMVGRWFGEVVSWVAGLPGRISTASRGMWDGIKNSLKTTINSLISMWNNLSFTIGGGSFMGYDIPSLTLSTPNIPYLAEGGITTGPTLAMIGEGREQEAVLPLSKLEQMISTPRAMPAPSVTRVEPGRVTLEIVGGDSEFVDFIRAVTRTKAGGSVIRLAEG